jgi:hypothetical protein
LLHDASLSAWLLELWAGVRWRGAVPGEDEAAGQEDHRRGPTTYAAALAIYEALGDPGAERVRGWLEAMEPDA